MPNKDTQTNSDDIDEILLQFIAEYHQGLNELAGHGTAIEQAKSAISKKIVEARIKELEEIAQHNDNANLIYSYSKYAEGNLTIADRIKQLRSNDNE